MQSEGPHAMYQDLPMPKPAAVAERLDCGSDDPGSIPGLPSDDKEVKDILGCPGVRVGVGSAR